MTTKDQFRIIRRKMRRLRKKTGKEYHVNGYYRDDNKQEQKLKKQWKKFLLKEKNAHRRPKDVDWKLSEGGELDNLVDNEEYEDDYDDN